MRVFFTGAGGQGKSTTAQIVSERLQVPVWDGVSRSSPYKMGTAEHQDYISEIVFDRCMNLEGVHTRTPLDVMAYTLAYNKGNYGMDNNRTARFLSSKPKIVYFPMLIKPEEDGFRPTDNQLNRSIDRTIIDTLRMSGLDFLTLDLESPEERAEKIITFVKG